MADSNVAILGSLDLGTATVKIFSAFAKALDGKAQNKAYVKLAFENYLRHIDEINKMVESRKIKRATAVIMIETWKQALESTIAASQGVTLAQLQAAMNAALTVLASLVASAINAGIKAAVA